MSWKANFSPTIILVILCESLGLTRELMRHTVQLLSVARLVVVVMTNVNLDTD